MSSSGLRLEADAFGRGAGAFELTLTDSEDGRDSLVFTGTPAVTAPGSLGVTLTLTSSNVLTVQVVDTDPFNVEQITIEGLLISATADAPLGGARLLMGACSGSLVACPEIQLTGSPATVIAAS